MRKVLFIAYYYAPYQSPGGMRASKTTKYLPAYGWLPLVLTAPNDYLPDLPLETPPEQVWRTRQFDVNALPKRLLRRSNGEGPLLFASGQSGWLARLVQVSAKAYAQLLNFPDGQIGWYTEAVKAGRQLVAEHKPDVIFSSSSPVTAHLVACRLAREARIPWVAEFRDLWTDNHHFRRIAPLRQIEVAIEQRIISRAQVLVTVSEPWAAVLRRRFALPVEVVFNGFDPGDYPALAKGPERFTLTYTGAFYPGYYDADALLDAIATLHREGRVNASNFQLRLVGRFLEGLRSKASEKGISDLVSLQATVSHERALRLQMESTALLYWAWQGWNGEGCYSAKLYEYLGSGRPVLAIGPRDNVGVELILSCHAGVTAQKAQEVRNVLDGWIAEYESTGQLTFQPKRELVSSFERRILTGKLARIFDRVATGTGAAANRDV